MENRKQATNSPKEFRALTSKIELRTSDGKSPEIFGYALKFGVAYDMGWFTEEIHRDALKDAEMSDVRVLFNHDSNQILGRTKSGTASVGVDEVGMWYSVTLPNSPIGENVREAVGRGDIDQSSWGFSMKADGDVWEKRGGKHHRTITGISAIYDASPVTFPANPDTTVAKRSLEMVQNTEAEKINRQKELEAEIGILDALFQAESLKNSFLK